jgi:hypothetical protein
MAKMTRRTHEERRAAAAGGLLGALHDAKVCKFPRIAPDSRFVEHPGYNRDRGAIPIRALTASFEF